MILGKKGEPDPVEELLEELATLSTRELLVVLGKTQGGMGFSELGHKLADSYDQDSAFMDGRILYLDERARIQNKVRGTLLRGGERALTRMIYSTAKTLRVRARPDVHAVIMGREILALGYELFREGGSLPQRQVLGGEDIEGQQQ